VTCGYVTMGGRDYGGRDYGGRDCENPFDICKVYLLFQLIIREKCVGYVGDVQRVQTYFHKS
jgi:hypothetical protein